MVQPVPQLVSQRMRNLNLSIDGLDYLNPNYDISDRNLALKNDFVKYKEWFDHNSRRIKDEANFPDYELDKKLNFFNGFS